MRRTGVSAPIRHRRPDRAGSPLVDVRPRNQGGTRRCQLCGPWLGGQADTSCDRTRQRPNTCAPPLGRTLPGNRGDGSPCIPGRRCGVFKQQPGMATWTFGDNAPSFPDDQPALFTPVNPFGSAG